MVQQDLLPEFLNRENRGQGVAIRGCEEFHMTGVGQSFECIEDFGHVAFELLDDDSGYRQGDPEISAIFL